MENKLESNSIGWGVFKDKYPHSKGIMITDPAKIKELDEMIEETKRLKTLAASENEIQDTNI
jgi:hypothetical protein